MKPATRTRLLAGRQPLTDTALLAAAPKPKARRLPNVQELLDAMVNPETYDLRAPLIEFHVEASRFEKGKGE